MASNPNATAVYQWAGNRLCGILYGLYVPIAFMTLRLLRKRYTSKIFTYYTYATLTTVTVWLILAMYNEHSYDRIRMGLDPPIIRDETQRIAAAVNCLFIWNALCGDALLLYRIWALWRRKFLVLLLPTLMFMSCIIIMSVFVALGFSPIAIQQAKLRGNLCVSYWAISMAANLLFAGMVSFKLLLYHRKIGSALGGNDTGYLVTVTAVVVESAALHAALSLCTLVSFAVDSQMYFVFVPILGMVQVICPALIIFRVAAGTAFNPSTEESKRTPIVAIGRTRPYDSDGSIALDSYASAGVDKGHHRGW